VCTTQSAIARHVHGSTVSMKPSVGRIVHVVFEGDQDPRPAIVTLVVEDDLINATVFSSTSYPTIVEPIEFECEDREQKVFWRWPPRV